MTISRFDIEYTKAGEIFQQQQVDDLLSGIRDASDLIMISHGWNNDKQDARRLYDALLVNFEKVNRATSPNDTRRLVLAQLFWPSKKFTNEELIPGGGAAGAHVANDSGLGAMLDALAYDPEHLPEESGEARLREVPAERQQHLANAKMLASQLEEPENRQKYVAQLRALVSPDAASEEEDGGDQFFSKDPEELFANLMGPIPLARVASAGGAAAVDSAADGGAAGLGDLLSGTGAAARRLANLATYYQMKSRAGLVGSHGVAALLRAVRRQAPGLKLHLVGHSFGARVVTAAANELAPNTPSVTMTLLQGAYSHDGLAQDYVPGKNGAFRRVLSERRISGPIVITHTKNDMAVGVAYPLASRIAHQVAAALGDENDPYGGIGRNGALHTPEAVGNELELGEYDAKYSFVPGAVYNLKSDRFIAGHNMVTGPQVAGALLAAMRAI